jgi:hypothetical protein
MEAVSLLLQRRKQAHDRNETPAPRRDHPTDFSALALVMAQGLNPAPLLSSCVTPEQLSSLVEAQHSHVQVGR